MLILIINKDVGFKLPIHKDPAHQWQLILATDRGIKSKLNTNFNSSEIFTLKDHSTVIFQLQVKRDPKQKKPITPRKVYTQ